MKILLLNRAFYPDSVATSQYVTDIARDLDVHGHRVTVVCGRRDYTTGERTYASFATVGGVRVYRVASTWFGKGSLVARILDAASYDLMSLWRLARLPRQDMVIAFTSPPLAGFCGALVARLWRARFVHWIMNVNHEIAIEMGYLRRGSLLARTLTRIHRFTLRACDRVVVMDRWMKERVERESVVDPQDIAVVPLWPVHDADASDKAAADVNALRNEHGLSGKFVVLHSGNLSYIHPLDTVLDAAVRCKADASIAFVFIGHGVREREIDERVRDEGLTNVVKLPYQPRELLGAALALADLHLIVMGSATSGLAHSSKIYSILVSGQPFVVVGPRDNHIMSDVLGPCPGGYHVEHGDVEGLLSVIEKARRMTAAERSHIRTMNRALVTARFDREQTLCRFREQVIGAAPMRPMSATKESEYSPRVP